MKSIGSVAVLHPQDSLNKSTPHISHRSINFNHSYTNSSSPNPRLTDNKRRTPTNGINKKSNNRHTDSSNRSEFFAGSVFVDSPPPSSVPIPGFFRKNFVSGVKDDPTTELRRILGLNLS